MKITTMSDKKIKLLVSLLTIALIFCFGFKGDIRAYAASDKAAKAAFTETAESLAKSISSPTADDVWIMYGLSVAGYPLSDETLNKFHKSVVSYVKSKDGKLTITERDRGGIITETDSGQYTEYSKLVLVLRELGMDPKDVGGYDLVDPLADIDKIFKQGINGPIWALMALDSCGFNFSSEAKASAGSSLTTRDKLIDRLLKAQLSDGGWAFMGTKADPDITGMTVRALAPHYNDNTKIKKAIDKAVTCMSKMQLKTGDFATIMEEGAEASPTSESGAQVICAISLLGIDPDKDTRFVKNSNSAIDALLSYYISGGKGFKHIKSNTKANALATSQCFYALAHYYRYVLGQYYDMSDENIKKQKEKEEAKARYLKEHGADPINESGEDPSEDKDKNQSKEEDTDTKAPSNGGQNAEPSVPADPSGPTSTDGNKNTNGSDASEPDDSTKGNSSHESNNEEGSDGQKDNNGTSLDPSDKNGDNTSAKDGNDSSKPDESIDKPDESKDDSGESNENKTDNNDNKENKKIVAGGVTYGGGQTITSSKIKPASSKADDNKKKKEDPSKTEDKKKEDPKDNNKDKAEDSDAENEVMESSSDSSVVSEVSPGSATTENADYAGESGETGENSSGLPLRELLIGVLGFWLGIGTSSAYRSLKDRKS